ncbi:hypothetical protein [Rubritalea tangerina]|uniref:hypothetical protein n=1 Tax=Rubritalea tangerina TaxID=430798 RepID=UPI0036195409
MNHPVGSSFRTSSITGESPPIAISNLRTSPSKKIKLPASPVGVSGYNIRLNPFINGADRELARKLTFSKMSALNGCVSTQTASYSQTTDRHLQIKEQTPSKSKSQPLTAPLRSLSLTLKFNKLHQLSESSDQ